MFGASGSRALADMPLLGMATARTPLHAHLCGSPGTERRRLACRQLSRVPSLSTSSVSRSRPGPIPETPLEELQCPSCASRFVMIVKQQIITIQIKRHCASMGVARLAPGIELVRADRSSRRAGGGGGPALADLRPVGGLRL